MSRSIESVAVIGAGTMGAGIAAASASAGCRVLILDTNPETVEAALQQVDDEARHLVTTGTVDADRECRGSPNESGYGAGRLAYPTRAATRAT